ncbi:MAG: phytanoyl-CoA dioxygenase family protein [Dokdonia sp.]|jgi:ectoine hydroxylase-related dioxygenase (phytanoyl-CoA dioxygenase family)
MRRIFNNSVLEADFREKGYVIVPFIEEEAIASLTEDYFRTLDESGGRLGPADEKFSSNQEITYDFTFIDKNIAYKEKVFDLITAVFKSHTTTLLDNYKPIIANFIRKKTDGGEVPMHQNWAFVDEEKYTSVSIWCPLVDSNRENGTLEVVPGSHKRYGKTRGPMIKSELLEIEDDIIRDFMVPLEVKAGQAVILDDSIVHYSSPNHTSDLRLAIQLIMIPEEVPSIHYHMDLSKDRKKVEVLLVDKDFYMAFNPWKKPSPDIPRQSQFEYEPFSMSISEFKKGLQGSGFDAPAQDKKYKGILHKLFKI